jgi:hypothetical protein
MLGTFGMVLELDQQIKHTEHTEDTELLNERA